ncbi:insulin receptor substrate 1 chico isoform X1 [Haemaphysalis longicornis]
MSTKSKDASRGNGVVSLAEQATDIHKTGYLRKFKTMKKKFFVMRRESEAGPARLEVYDSEKKWKAGVLPKRTIALRSCFNINRRADAKQRHVLALYTRDDSFALVCENEAELEAWLNELLLLQRGSGEVDGDARPKPLFEHVWQVNVKTKGLGSSRNITGPHRLCLTASALTLVKMHTDQENPETLEFPLMSIRRCGHSDCFFFMELGRSSVTGSGELWMQTEDTVIAQNMHETILGAMKTSRNKEELGAFARPRSSSTSENSKPITHKRPAHAVGPAPHASTSCRDRCDSMPTSRSRNSSESHGETSGLGRTHTAESAARPHSAYGRTYSVSPPSNNPITVGSFDSTSSVLSMEESDGQAEYFNRYSHSLPMDIMAGPKEPTIKEEAAVDEYLMMSSPVGSSKGSHYPRPTTLVSNLGSHQQAALSEPNDYLKMSMSPASTVPEGNGDGYIPMSPVGSMSLSSSLEKTAPPSSAADMGYLSMEPQGATAAVPCTTARLAGFAGCSSPTVVHAGFPCLAVPPAEYMDMAPLSSSLPKSVGESCTDFSGSWCSAHSLQDVPSSASPLSASLEGFHLDKVKSYFSPSEDDSEAYIKPVRAYSIGSRQQVKKSPFAGGHMDQSRVRAYSVGSQVAPTAFRRRLKRDAELDPHGVHRLDGQKSSSVPTLQEDAATSQQQQQQQQVPRAFNYNEDLMEINYDRSDLGQGTPDVGSVVAAPPAASSVKKTEAPEPARKLSTSSPSTAKACNDYMVMVSTDLMEINYNRSELTEHAPETNATPPPSVSTKKVEVAEPARKLGTTSAPCAPKACDDYMVMGGSESSAGVNSSYQRAFDTPTSFEAPERKLSMPSSVRQRKEDLGKENQPGGRSSSYAGMTRRSSTTQQALREDNAASVSSPPPANGLNISRAGEYVATEMTKKGVAFLSTSNGTVTRGKSGLPHLTAITTAAPSLRPPSPEGQQLGEYVNLDLSKTWKWTQPMKVQSGETTPTATGPNGSAPWGAYPKPQQDSPTFTRASAPLAVAETYVQLGGPSDGLAGASQQLPPEANYENISLKGGGGATTEAPVERVLNYASLDLAPPSGGGDDGSVAAVQRSPRATGMDAATEEGPSFTYAEIDFTKSEGLRNISGAVREGRLL